MFKKNNSGLDMRKSQYKCVDLKRDTATRIKHLKTVLECTDSSETKTFLEGNFSIVFHLFYEVFLTAEQNLRQKGAFAVQRSHREELEHCLLFLDRILCLLPELLRQRWQSNALTHVFKKLLHPNNTLHLKKEATRLFILWYQIVGENRSEEMDCMFASLVDGFPVPPSPVSQIDSKGSKVSWIEPNPVLLPASTEKTPDDISAYMLRNLLDFMVSQVRRVEWKNKAVEHAKSFSYLFNRFKYIYLPYIFPNFNPKNSLYKPNLELPELRSSPGISPYGSCPVVLVDWVKKYVATPPRKLENIQESKPDDGRRSSQSEHETAGNTSDRDSVNSAFIPNDEQNEAEDSKIVRDTLFSSRENIDFIHELFRQTLRLCFRYSIAMKSVIQCYCDWIKLAASTSAELPSFMLEASDNDSLRLTTDSESEFSRRLRADSYLGAINPEMHIRAGLQNFLQVFVTNAANVFLLIVSSDYSRLLDEQVDLCKLVLNTYRYMVMNSRMEQKTWEQLLIILFHITSQTLQDKNKQKNDSLGRRFAAALFQTLIVSWIKANLSVVISIELWDQLLATLSSLTHWEELIKEWSKTMDTLTKVLARHVYDLELNNLPLDRLTERRALKKGVSKPETKANNKNNNARAWIQTKSELGTKKLNSECRSVSTSSYETRKETEGKGRDSFDSAKTAGCHSNEVMHRSAHSSGSHRSSTFLHHRQHSEGYYRHHLYSFKRSQFKWASDPSLARKKFPHKMHQMIYFSRSLDYFPCSFDDLSRSPSPAMSSDVDSSSFRDHPVPMYIADSLSLDTLEDSMEQRSVMSGGTVRGWLPDVSVVLWRRVLGLLGDPNDVISPQVHEQIFNYLLNLTDTLIKLRNNQGVSTDNQTTPEPDILVPPIQIIVPWCFRALILSPQYSAGKLLAYRILCKILIRKHDVPISKDVLVQFIAVLHDALICQEMNVTQVVIKGCSPNFFSLDFAGSSVLILDFIFAANAIVSSPQEQSMNSQVGKFEAITLLGSLYPLICENEYVPVLQPQTKGLAVFNCYEVKDHLIHVLLKCAKKEWHWKTRCQAIVSLAVFLCHELSTCKPPNRKVNEVIEVIIASLKIGKLVSQISSDVLLLLTEFSHVIVSTYKDLPHKIIQMICCTLCTLSGDRDFMASREGEHLMLSLIFCLTEWVMKLSQSLLIQPSVETKPLLHLVFKTLNLIESGSKPSSNFVKSLKLETVEVDARVKEEAAQSPQLVANKVGTLRRNAQSVTAASTLQLAARAITGHIVNHLWQFPLCLGPERLSSLVCETDDLPQFNCDDLTTDIFYCPNVQLFALNRSCVVSLVQLPALQKPGDAITTGFKTPNSEVRVIVRDLCGKFCWDACTLFAPPSPDFDDHMKENTSLATKIVQNNLSPQYENSMTSSIIVTSLSHLPLRHRSVGAFPSVEDSADDLDNVDDLLAYIGFTSPEVLEQFGQDLNEPVPPPCFLPHDRQNEAISSILNQRNTENEYLMQHVNDSHMSCPEEAYPRFGSQEQSLFQQCRKFFDQLGLASFEKRKSIFTLRKNEKLLREIKNLDNQKCRETHKIAVLFVGDGQEDKTSILNNSGGSKAFEDFVGGLGWEVELASHCGVLGGLHRNGTSGETAPYFATSLTEVIFHVSTRMPSSSEECCFQKLRHLGNDEVHIVWSEHRRDYRRGIISTEFCDVLIIIYPLENDFHRIQIDTKADVPFFGPLFNGAIIHKRVLSKLVRATALNASRAKRSRLPFYQQFYEERSRSLETIMDQHSESTTFEKFISDIYSPIVSSYFNRPNNGTVLNDQPTKSNVQIRSTSYSPGEQHNIREKVRNVASDFTHFSSTSFNPNFESGVDSLSPSSSPRLVIPVPTHSTQRKLATSQGLTHKPSFSQPRPSNSPNSPIAPPRRSRESFLYHSPRNK